MDKGAIFVPRPSSFSILSVKLPSALPPFSEVGPTGVAILPKRECCGNDDDDDEADVGGFRDADVVEYSDIVI